MDKYNFNPFPVLETDRLMLKEVTLADAETLFELRRNPDVMRYIDRPIPTVIDEVNELIQKMKSNKEEGLGISWGIYRKENPNYLIGNIGFFRTMPEHFRAEIGYMLDPLEHRKGIMTEAIKAVLRYGFDSMKLHSVEADINAANIASENILLKNGFVKEAFFKENYYFNGRFIDTAIFSLLTDVKN